MVQQGRSGGDQCITVIRWHLRERNDGLPTRLERRNRELGTRLGLAVEIEIAGLERDRLAKAATGPH
jgi:hypothetical protein